MVIHIYFLYNHFISRMEAFEIRLRRRIEEMKRTDMITDVEVLRRQGRIIEDCKKKKE